MTSQGVLLVIIIIGLQKDLCGFDLFWTLDIIANWFLGKLMNQTWENEKKASFRLILVSLGP